MACKSGDEMFQHLCKLIPNMPRNARRVVLTLAVDELVSVEAEFYAEQGDEEPVTKRFLLVEEDSDIDA